MKNWPKAYYGGNFDRLTRLKDKYDTRNVFLITRREFRLPEEIYDIDFSSLSISSTTFVLKFTGYFLRTLI
ncbi:BBE domain-containing protein [Desulfoscipio gibsoniae]|uniref:BBE domain-containing protein n=1 Tax=Desulfoscipio gibsoniae TaxID=102134 RepID=UPI0009FECDEC|nr:BBE domain-containing protein [Desulfoscipio gibsoniae]